jgi:hypothetical protein
MEQGNFGAPACWFRRTVRSLGRVGGTSQLTLLYLHDCLPPERTCCKVDCRRTVHSLQMNALLFVVGIEPWSHGGTFSGYLWFRNLLDREKVLALRRRICAALSDLRWIDEDQASDLGTTTTTPPPDSIIMDPHDWPIFDRVQKMEEFHALPHSPSLTHALEIILGEAVLMHPRHICRSFL